MPQAFPGETFRNHIGILEKANSKTTAAEGFARRLMNEGRRLCVIDPAAFGGACAFVRSRRS